MSLSNPASGTSKTPYMGVLSHSKPELIPESNGRLYRAPVFDGKAEQKIKVSNHLRHLEFMPAQLVDMEVDWFYTELGIEDSYFAHASVESIASIILSLYASKVSTYAREDKKLVLDVQRESEDQAVFLETCDPHKSTPDSPHYEKYIDEKYLTPYIPGKRYRVESFHSPIHSDAEPQKLVSSFVYKCNYKDPEPEENETDIYKIADVGFLEKVNDQIIEIFQKIILETVDSMGPVIELFEVGGIREYRLVIGFQAQKTPLYFSSLSHLFNYYGISTARKYYEPFSNGVCIMSVYLRPGFFPGNKYPVFEHAIHQVVKEASLLYCLPQPIFTAELAGGEFSLQEAVYAHCALLFVTHFLNRLGPEYETLLQIVDTKDQSNLELLDRLKQRLRGETFTLEYIIELVRSERSLIHDLYVHFANIHYVQGNTDGDNFLPTLSRQRLETNVPFTTEELRHEIKKRVTSEHAAHVMNAFLEFNTHVLKTNFYTPTKIALAYRLDPSFLPAGEYPNPLFGMFLIIGQEFHGFHLRFRDVARGGIRIVLSRNKQFYDINTRNIFDENYNLANTQQRKNKDIPEGGSKGVILLDWNHQDKITQSFQKYIDAVIDLLLPGNIPGVKEAIVDLYGKQEILFMGPDENTAGLVNWATKHAKARGASWWKSFFTGKSPSIGGIPHDKYGMTSLSVREYVEGIYRKENLENTTVHKLQTGGPDGDLGSNEILLSTNNEAYIAIIDGSGVLVDPCGIDKEELRRLARNRVPISNFDTSKLSKDGYRVLVDDTDVTLPDGTVVDSGVLFRNRFHLIAVKKYKIDIFVPCGGRPEAINIGNVHEYLDEATGLPRVSYIVEGANLFLSQSAKLELEAAGAIVFKDASANKGGVTSSSLEVLASLAFDDKRFHTDMCVSESGEEPAFYRKFVQEVQERVKLNARLEFEALWRDHEVTGKARSVLSDELSNQINLLSDNISSSSLWDEEKFRNAILKKALLPSLVEKLGLDTILENVPENYLKAIFGSWIAGNYIYQHGTQADQFAFYEYMTRLHTEAYAN